MDIIGPMILYTHGNGQNSWNYKAETKFFIQRRILQFSYIKQCSIKQRMQFINALPNSSIGMLFQKVAIGIFELPGP